MESRLKASRAGFLTALMKGPLTIDKKGIPSIADSGSAISIGISQALFSALGGTISKVRGSGQTAGRSFEGAVAQFLRETFLELRHLRPGKWDVFDGAKRDEVAIVNYQQYHHLLRLAEKTKHDPDLRAALGGDYFIQPDVVIARQAEADDYINSTLKFVDESTAKMTPLRAANPDAAPGKLLHASISCKWTIRSDRSQNARTEASNLIRHRNGRVPHIVAITAEPLPKRIASLAQGTNDLDCVYHIALPELRIAVEQSLAGRRSEQLEDLDMLMRAKRLRDISDLPLDLAV